MDNAISTIVECRQHFTVVLNYSVRKRLLKIILGVFMVGANCYKT